MSIPEPVPSGRLPSPLTTLPDDKLSSDWFQFAIGLKEYVKQAEEEIKEALSVKIKNLLG